MMDSLSLNFPFLSNMRTLSSDGALVIRWWAGGELGIAGSSRSTGTIMSEVTPNAVATMLQPVTIDPLPPLTIDSQREAELISG